MLASRIIKKSINYKNKEPVPIYVKEHYAKKIELKKFIKIILLLKDIEKHKWSKDFFYNLFLEKNVFFISINNPLEGYLIGRKIVDEYEILSLATDIEKEEKELV